MEPPGALTPESGGGGLKQLVRRWFDGLAPTAACGYLADVAAWVTW